MTFKEKFEHLKQTYADSADLSKLTCDFAAQITLTDDDCHGTFYISYLGGKLAVEPYDYRDNTTAIQLSSTLLEDIINGKADAIEAFRKGELQAEGDPGHALMLINALKKQKKQKKEK